MIHVFSSNSYFQLTCNIKYVYLETGVGYDVHNNGLDGQFRLSGKTVLGDDEGFHSSRAWRVYGSPEVEVAASPDSESIR